MIQNTIWRGQNAWILENGLLRAVVLPALGGKLGSLVYTPTGFELAAQPPTEEYMTPEPEAIFAECDASGLDDAFPSLDASDSSFGQRMLYYPDHGEIWKNAFSTTVQDDTLALTYHSQSFCYTYKKQVVLKGNRVHVHYNIQNCGSQPLPCIWTFHGLVRYEPDMRLEYPAGATLARSAYPSAELGKEGSLHSLKKGGYDFSRVPPPESRSMVKYYLEGPVHEGYCAYRYPSQGMQAALRFDHSQLPYLGFWVTTGGFRGDYNCAFEPSNGFYDSIEKARANKALPVLQAGEELDFALCFELSPL